MNTNSQTLNKILAVATLALLTSCGTSKSTTSSVEQSSRVEIDSSKPLASCNRVDNANLSMSIANVIANDGKADLNWVKVKFNFLSTDTTTTGYHIKFFKWRVINNATQIDQNPLEFSSYSLTNGATNSTPMTGVFATNVNTQNGFYLNLKDDVSYPYQVLKVVVYKTDGTVASQTNVLIPQFLANPVDYKSNPDGSPRNQLLQGMHPLYSHDTTTWTRSQFQQAFDQHCF